MKHLQIPQRTTPLFSVKLVWLQTTVHGNNIILLLTDFHFTPDLLNGTLTGANTFFVSFSPDISTQAVRECSPAYGYVLVKQSCYGFANHDVGHFIVKDIFHAVVRQLFQRQSLSQRD
ncbi:hypothetical protein HA45_12920 [Pantoea rodasii]|nr:hypothetical protein HA45_12920 [Pantoea rodasii]